ncbi:MAG: hypothetical protein LBI99_02300 [Propionibacteriaceae bacterium]|jgi:plasmid stability protein|nr:hypothetical protein [Propionibacteriaceae bacterium]
MSTLTVRNLETDVYEDLKVLASARHASMEAEARDILSEGVKRRRRWLGAKLADLSGNPALAGIEAPLDRSVDLPRDFSF